MNTTQKISTLSTISTLVLIVAVILLSSLARAEITQLNYTASGKGGYVQEYTFPDKGYLALYVNFFQHLSQDGSEKSTRSSGHFASYTYNLQNRTSKVCSGWIDLDRIKGTQGKATVHGKGTINCSEESAKGVVSTYPEKITVNINIACSDESNSDNAKSDNLSYIGPWGEDTYKYNGEGSYCGAEATGSIKGDVDTNIKLGHADYSTAALGDWKYRDEKITIERP